MKYIISNSKFIGTVNISGAKNSYLRLLAASLLTSQRIFIKNSPIEIMDGKIHIEMLEKLGKDVISSISNNGEVIIEENKALNQDLKWTKRRIRNTLLILGALTTRFGRGVVPVPGGCQLGERKYDIHIHLLEKLGATINEENGYLLSDAPNGLHGTDIHLPIRSTGATENAILCAVLAKGTTTVWNPHIRPEIIDLISFLQKMGAKIRAFGQERIVIDGVSTLSGCEHSVIPDNMESLTWLIASVITNGDIQIDNFPFEHLEVPLIFLKESGTKIYRNGSSAIIRDGKPYPLEISTGPYPGINSDMQPIMAVYGAVANGETRIIDLRFPGRYKYASELGKLGMDFEVRDNLLVIRGGKKLKGNKVTALDLRAGAALAIAACVSEGKTIIQNAEQVERGYNDFVKKFRLLGGQIEVIQ